MAKRENDRADIIRAAIELVAENGIAAVTTRQIAKKAGVSDGLMYRFFNSKEDLLASCLYQIADNIADHFQAEVTRKISGQEEFKRVAHERWNMYFSYLLENVSETLFFYEFSESANMRKLLVGCVAALVVAAGAFITYDRLMLNESYLSYDESGLYVEDDMLKTATGYHCQYGFDAPGSEIEFITLTTTPYENYRNSRSDVKDIREVRDLSQPQESVIEYDGVKEFHKIKKIYYVPPEYAEKLMGQGYWSDDHDESTGEEGYIKANKDKIDELVSVSTLIWERK